MLRDYFNEKAAVWDETAAEKNLAKLTELAGQIGLKSGDVVLDVGTGTGVFLSYILEIIGPTGLVYALDVAEKMLAEAQKKYPQLNIKYLHAGVENIPLPDAACDVVNCYSCFPHFSDKTKALMEIKRVLKPGGVVFIGHTSGRDHINNIHRHIEAVKDHLLPDAIEMQQMFNAAGFIGVRVADKQDSYSASARKPDSIKAKLSLEL